MVENVFTQTELAVIEQIKFGADFVTICQTTTLSPHSAKSVLRMIVKKLNISSPEIIAIRHFCDKK